MTTQPPHARRICIVTGTRAEYGLLFWLMKELSDDPRVELQIVATGSHLSPEFGSTVDLIGTDGFEVTECVEMLLSSDSEVGTTKSAGVALIGFADAFRRLKPDVVVLLGDRYEAFAVAAACLFARIPVAHLCGGELTLGAFDDCIRHSITKMASLHFVTHPSHRRRVLQLGEEDHRVADVGNISAENVARMTLLAKEDAERALKVSLERTTFLVTYHPATLRPDDSERELCALIEALAGYPDATIIFTLPNADPASRSLRARILAAVALNPKSWHAFDSLGQLRYLSIMAHSDVVVGNSSSGLLEAPLFGVPSVNIGERQSGRLRPSSVIDCTGERKAIGDALRFALAREKSKLPRMPPEMYPSRKMLEILVNVRLRELTQKGFVDQMFPDAPTPLSGTAEPSGADSRRESR
jgi:UDP-hydrolysing UDP-N-acetyl-D-glucosamine 2-epimerase